MMRFALKKASVVAVGDGVKNNLKIEYKIANKDIHVIYNAINLENIEQ